MKVLVVDDDVVSRMVLMHLVDSCGEFEILEAEDGEDAWQMLAAGARPAIIFCDLRMPRLSGMELLQRLRADPAHAGLPFILVSSATDEATVAEATGAGVTGYIVKPFQVDQVRVHLAPLLSPQPSAALEAEAPAATVARLGIGADRLLLYLGGFQNQLTTAGAEIEGLLDHGDSVTACMRIDRLHAGCLTLGLNGAARVLKQLAAQPLAATNVHAVLGEVIQAVAAQGEAVRRLLTGAP